MSRARKIFTGNSVLRSGLCSSTGIETLNFKQKQNKQLKFEIMEQQLNSSTGGWIGDDRRDEDDFLPDASIEQNPMLSAVLK